MERLRFFLKFILVINLFLPSAVFAGHLLSISAITSFPSEVNTSSTTTAIFRITNITSRLNVTAMDQTSYPDGMRSVSSTCGNLMGPNQFCDVQLQFNAPSSPRAISFTLRFWAKNTTDGVQQFPITIKVIKPMRSVAIAAGTNGVTNQPLLITSQDSAVTWKVNTISNLPASGNFNGASCTGNPLIAVCIVAGEDSILGTPFLAISNDGASAWTGINFSGSINAGYFDAASCTGNDNTAICAAAGRDTTPFPSLALLTWSRDGGATWSFEKFSNGYLHAVDCIGEKETAVCAAVGQGVSDGLKALSVVSVDGGRHWEKRLLPVENSQYNSVSCVGDTVSNMFCAAAGEMVFSGISSPLLVGTTDGENWTAQSVSKDGGVVTTGRFSGVSCTGPKDSMICAAAGADLALSVPYLVVTRDAAVHWFKVTSISGFPSAGKFNDVSCTGSGSEAFCVAVGIDETSPDPNSQPPFLVVGTNGASNWTVKPIANRPDGGELNAVHCSGSSAATTICTAVGGTAAGAPLLVVSVDGGNTWAVKSAAQVAGLPAAGWLNSASGVRG